MKWVIKADCRPSNPLTLQGFLSRTGLMPRKLPIVFAKLVSMKVYPLAPVSMREVVLMPNPLLLTVHGRVNTSPSSNWLKSTSAISIPYGPEEETSFRSVLFPGLH
jgi:hypothetical protein